MVEYLAVAEDAGTRSLIRAALRTRARNNNENIEDGAERGHTEEDRCDGDIDRPKVMREGTAKEQ